MTLSIAEQRPEISQIDSGEELRRWYWLKAELVAEARRLGVKRSGGKFTILERLCHFHDTGSKRWPGDVPVSPQSAFDWSTSQLTTTTIVTDNYRNTQNVRRFFRGHVGPGFKFTIALMDWFKVNVGSTLGDALAFVEAQSRDHAPTKIKPHNQFNQYCRDFLADNPTLGMSEVRQAWAVRRRLPSENGRHVYDGTDVEFLRSEHHL